MISRALVEKLRSVDNAFRKQMDAAQRGHEENMEQLAQEKQAEIEEAQARVSRLIIPAYSFSCCFLVVLLLLPSIDNLL